MTIVITDNIETPKVKFGTLRIGQVFKDSAGDYSMKIEETADFNSVLLVPTHSMSAGRPWINDYDEEVTPVQFDVKVSPL